MRVGFAFDGLEGCAVLDPGEQSVYRDGVGIDPAVTGPLLRGVPFVVQCVSRVAARALRFFGEREVPVLLSLAWIGPSGT